jgi:uncharacterized protein YaiE (UPF0345 family)
MKLDISRMSRILSILSILILGGFQTTSALEYLITGTLGGTTALGDQIYNPNSGFQTLNVFVYLKYTGAEISGKGTGFLSGSLSLASSNDVVDVAVLNGTVPSTATTQAGVYAVQNARANGTAGTGWNAATPITASFADQSLLSATYAGRLGGNTFGTVSGTTYYLYLASATFTIDTSVPENSRTTIGASLGSTNWAGTTGGAFTAPTNDSFFISVPEPTTYALAAISCVALGTIGRRKSLKAKNQATA